MIRKGFQKNEKVALELRLGAGVLCYDSATRLPIVSRKPVSVCVVQGVLKKHTRDAFCHVDYLLKGKIRYSFRILYFLRRLETKSSFSDNISWKTYMHNFFDWFQVNFLYYFFKAQNNLNNRMVNVTLLNKINIKPAVIIIIVVKAFTRNT